MSHYYNNYREVLHQHTTKLHIYHVLAQWITTYQWLIAESFFDVVPIVVNARYVMKDVIPNLHFGFIHVRTDSTFYIMILTIVVIWGFLMGKLFVKFTFWRVWSELCGHYPLRVETIVLSITSHRWWNEWPWRFSGNIYRWYPTGLLFLTATPQKNGIKNHVQFFFITLKKSI